MWQCHKSTLFYFCIMVHNKARHILLLDFLWAHPNSLDLPIKSSGPNNVCNVCYIWIYLFIYSHISAKERASLLSCLGRLKRACTARTLESTHLDWILGRKGKSSLNPDSHTITNWASSWTLVEHKMAFYDINQGEHFIYYHLMHA